jgi:hypothetical protein
MSVFKWILVEKPPRALRQAQDEAPKRLILLPVLRTTPAAETWARTTVESNIWIRRAVELKPAKVSKKSSKTRALLSRSKRFQTLFQLPKRSGMAAKSCCGPQNNAAPPETAGHPGLQRRRAADWRGTPPPH